MKRTALLALLALLASPAWPQAAKPASDKPQAEKAAPKPVASADGRKSRRGEDARHCLEKPSNTEIIKCAEAYL
jgi:hypothetical protein